LKLKISDKHAKAVLDQTWPTTLAFLNAARQKRIIDRLVTLLVTKGLITPNQGRKVLGLLPVPGDDIVRLQA
jgi:hypothetical protein